MTTFNDYDAMAATYTKRNGENAWNHYYERPATIALAGDVRGLRVLDAGCGSGSHAAELIAGGALVTGLDSSAGMLSIARERLGQRAELLQADLAEPIPLPDEGFDLVLAPLVMHYLEDWVPALREFARLLVPGGRLVLSTHHPFMDYTPGEDENYFATYAITEEWDGVAMRFWHRPLTSMLEALAAAGFSVDTIREPMPLPEVRELFPDAYRSLTTRPRFLFFAAHLVA